MTHNVFCFKSIISKQRIWHITCVDVHFGQVKFVDSIMAKFLTIAVLVAVVLYAQPSDTQG